MQLYLCEKYDKDHKISFPYDSDEYWETVEWLVWMVSSMSPGNKVSGGVRQTCKCPIHHRRATRLHKIASMYYR
jgi:hypothetical protein